MATSRLISVHIGIVRLTSNIMTGRFVQANTIHIITLEIVNTQFNNNYWGQRDIKFLSQFMDD